MFKIIYLGYIVYDLRLNYLIWWWKFEKSEIDKIKNILIKLINIMFILKYVVGGIVFFYFYILYIYNILIKFNDYVY